MADRIQQRRDTAARWAQYNPILLEGEVGYVTDDPNQYKIGDGVHTWNELPLRGFDGTLVHELGDSQTAAMSQQGVTKVNDNAYIRDAISVANAVVINTVETAEIGVEIEWVNTGKVLRDDGTLSDNSGLKTSDYISCLDNKTPIALIGSFISYDKGFANVAYYTEDENHSFLCAFNIKSARFAVIPGVCARISIRNADTARFSSINIVQNVTLAKFSDIVSNLGDNKLSVYSEFDVGDIIEPDEIITSHWINGSGNVVSINSENFTVYKYNVENLPPTFAVRGKVGAQSASSAFVFTNKENVDYDVIYREAIAENTYPDYNRMVVTPYDAKYFYLARYKNSGIGLNLMAAYNIAFKTNKSDIGYAVMDYASVMKGYYIGSGGVLTEIQSNNYRVNIYEVTHLRGKEIAIDGEFGAEAAITPYAFSDNDTDIYTAQTFDNMPSGAPHRFYKKERVSVPLQASYLFIMNYVPYGPVKVYSIVEKTGDNHIDDTQRIEQIEKFTGMLVKMTPQETKTSYFLNASKQPTLLADGGAPKWRVLVYDVSQLDKVYLKGTIDSSAESYAYAFSTNAETVDGDGFRLNDAGGNNMSWKFDDYVYIPEGAKYLFLSSYDSGGDVLYAYSLSTDNALDRGSSSIKLLDSDVLICPIYG